MSKWTDLILLVILVSATLFVLFLALMTSCTPVKECPCCEEVRNEYD